MEPQKRKIAYVVGSEGDVTKYVPPAPPAALTREERYHAYYSGIAKACQRLKECGFSILHEAPYSVSMEYRKVLFDFRIQLPGNVAHVTSGKGFVPGKGKATIYRLRDEVKSEHCLQLIVGSEESLPPVYIPLDEALNDPADFVYRTILGYLSSLARQQHRLGLPIQALPPEQRQIPEWIDSGAA